jgi:glycerophosphoryl diester phosphodiesterase
MTLPQLRIVAHRGASALAPENTLAAFAAALDLGVATVETDIRATRDGELVLSMTNT